MSKLAHSNEETMDQIAKNAAKQNERVFQDEPNHELIYAWTDVGGYKYYPQFFNLSFDKAANKMYGRDGIRLYVRGPEHQDNDGIGCGGTEQLFLPVEALCELAHAILAAFPTPPAPQVNE